MDDQNCCNQECSQGRNCPKESRPVSLLFIVVLVAGLGGLAILAIGVLLSSLTT
jgi:hypothetical protein